MAFDFRLRFHLQDTVHINSDLLELNLVELSDGSRIKLKGGIDDPIKNRHRLAVIGGPYVSENVALDAAFRARTALLLWATKQKLGIDLGSDYRAAYIFEPGLKMLEAQHGIPVRNDIHGIDVYGSTGEMRFALPDAKLNLGKSLDTFVADFRQVHSTEIKYSDRLKVACELYCSVFFDPSFQSRFITLVTAIEALLEPASRSVEAIRLVNTFAQTIKASGLSDLEKQQIISSLKWLDKDSIGQTGRKLAQRLLPNSRYADTESGAFFKHCYDTRSSIVHSGKAKLTMTQLASLTNDCMTFVADILAKMIDLEGQTNR